MNGRIGDKQRLEHILAATDEAIGFVTGFSFAQFNADARTLKACVRCIEIIGEAARHVTDAAKAQHPQVPWQKMVALRNSVIHQYFDVDNDVLWEVLTVFLPAAKPCLTAAFETA